MKKILSIFLVLTVCGAMFSCGGGASSPSAAAKKYAGYLVSGDYDKFTDGVNFTDASSPEEVEQGKAMLLSLLKDKAVKEYEKQGGLKSVDLVSEEISEDGKTAKVVLKYNYGDGSASDEECDMVLVDGKWLMSVDK